VVCIVAFALNPSFPTPDKLLVFLTFVFMVFGRAKELLKRLVPFVGLLLVYESFRGIVPHLNKHVNFTWMVHMDEWLFGTLPTRTFQGWWWHGHVQWYDFVFYLPYVLHFILPVGLALLIWKYREKLYWRFVTTFLTVSFMGFLTFLAFPAAPPWMAAEKGVIAPMERISSHVWSALGLNDFPSVYNKISPNPVAAVPSLHAAYATLVFIFVWRLFGKKWGLLALLHPLLIYIGTVYQGEHYMIDEIIGGLYALAAYFGVKLFWEKVLPQWRESGVFGGKEAS
jgi:hypothetical protein